MNTARLAAQARARLDERLAQFGLADRYQPPARGWIRAIRDALGMTAAQLGARLGVRQPSIAGLERSEERGSIELATLRRVAEALDCTLVYAFIPNQPLESTVRRRARAFLRLRRQPVEHSMLLEDQRVGETVTDADVDEVLRDTNPRRFWD